MNRTFEALSEIRTVFSTLAADVEEALAYGRSSGTDFAARSLFRTYFIQIEGLTAQFRKVALIVNFERPTLLSADDASALQDRKTSLDEKGRVKKSENFHPTLPAILFSMRCFGKAHGIQFEPDLGGIGYASFTKFLKLRNCLTHPKSASDLALSEEQTAFCMEAATWWKGTVLDLIQKCLPLQRAWFREHTGYEFSAE